jgi:hypothetical protein
MDGVRTFFSRLGRRRLKASEIANHEASEYISGEDYAAHLDKLLAWERGHLDEDETLAFFKELVSSGMAWKSTSSVWRTAALLICEGQIQRKSNKSIALESSATLELEWKGRSGHFHDQTDIYSSATESAPRGLKEASLPEDVS